MRDIVVAVPVAAREPVDRFGRDEPGAAGNGSRLERLLHYRLKR
jgi:hypothetical protein